MGAEPTAAGRPISGARPTRWSLFAEPRAAVGYVLVVDALALVLVAAAPWLVPVGRADVLHLLALLLVAAVVVEAGRQIERLRRAAIKDAPYVSLHALWVAAGLLLLPPSLLVVLIVVSYLHAWVRNRRLVVHRWAFSASAVLLGSASGAAVLAAVSPEGYPGVPADGPMALLAVLLAIATYSLTNLALVVGAILLSTPHTPARVALGDLGAHVISAALMGLGVAMAGLLQTLPWLVPVLAAAVLGLHRGLLLIHQLETVSRTDPKTAIANSTSWFDGAARELRRTQRGGTLLGVLVLDLDHFKRVNDEHGHLTGDVVLRAVARLLVDEVREQDLVGRVGGEEFAVALPGVAGLPELVRVAERLRLRVQDLRVPVPAGTDRSGRDVVVGGLGASVGAALSTVPGSTVDALLLAADTACYAAKAAGRNRVQVAGESGNVPDDSGDRFRSTIAARLAPGRIV